MSSADYLLTYLVGMVGIRAKWCRPRGAFNIEAGSRCATRKNPGRGIALLAVCKSINSALVISNIYYIYTDMKALLVCMPDRRNAGL